MKNKSDSLISEKNISDRFIYEIGQIAWLWNSIELLLDSALAFISGLDPHVLAILLPDANIQRKFQMFQRLLEANNYQDNVCNDGARHATNLLKLLDRRHRAVHARWIAILVKKGGQVAGLKVDKNTKTKITQTRIEELQSLSTELLKAYAEFYTFLTTKKLYPSR